MMSEGVIINVWQAIVVRPHVHSVISQSGRTTQTYSSVSDTGVEIHRTRSTCMRIRQFESSFEPPFQ